MRHHYVPQFLLRPWAESTPDDRVEVFRLDLDTLRSDRHATKYTGYENDLWALSVDVIAGMEKQAVETHFLRHVDDLAARALRKLDERGLKGLTRDDRMDWARFLMSLRLRQPNIVLRLREESADYLRRTLATEPEEYETLIQHDDPPTLAEWTQRKFPGLIENFGLSFFHELVNNPRIGMKILQMKWWIWNFADTKYDLLLADSPCIFTTGIDDSNLIIALPISPKTAFMATQSDHAATIMSQQEPKRLAARINEYSLLQARVRIYARNAASERFIRNRLWRRGKQQL